MLKKIFSLLLLASAATCAAEVASLQASPFQKIKVVGELNVDCVHCPDSAGLVVINAPNPEQLSWVEAEVKGDKLHLRLVKPEGVTTAGNLPAVKVYTRYLVKAENEGDSTLRILSMASVPEFDAKLIGNGRLSVRSLDTEKLTASLLAGRGIMALAGKSIKAKYSLAGSGTIEADALGCEEASVKMAGTGSIGVNASGKLSVNGAGSGTVYYLGSPQIKKTVAIGVKLQPLE